jgi:hypothetical protein
VHTHLWYNSITMKNHNYTSVLLACGSLLAVLFFAVAISHQNLTLTTYEDNSLAQVLSSKTSAQVNLKGFTPSQQTALISCTNNFKMCKSSNDVSACVKSTCTVPNTSKMTFGYRNTIRDCVARCSFSDSKNTSLCKASLSACVNQATQNTATAVPVIVKPTKESSNTTISKNPPTSTPETTTTTKTDTTSETKTSSPESKSTQR